MMPYAVQNSSMSTAFKRAVLLKFNPPIRALQYADSQTRVRANDISTGGKENF